MVEIWWPQVRAQPIARFLHKVIHTNLHLKYIRFFRAFRDAFHFSKRLMLKAFLSDTIMYKATKFGTE